MKKINIIVATSGDTGAAAISAIKNRKNVKSFIPDAFLIYQGIDYFKSKTITADLQNMFKKTPIYSNENFKSVFFNINKLQISSTYNSYLLYALSIMFGFLFALFIIFLKDIIININIKFIHQVLIYIIFENIKNIR